jgi:hypothetical protein
MRATLWFFHAIDRYVSVTGAAPRYALRHRRGSQGWAAPAGRPGLSAHLDGREGLLGVARDRGCVAQAWSVAEVLRCWLAIAP